MKATFLALLLCMFSTVSHAETPRIFREQSFNAADLAAAVNHFIALGEESAVQELGAIAPSHNFKRDSFRKGFSLPERVGWVCRVLFQSKGTQPLRAPSYGAHSLPYLTMGLARWPLYPVVASGNSFFVLSQGYMLAGVPEDPKRYLAYCRAEGVFRTQPVLIPTRNQAQRDLRGLRQSAAWEAIKWTDSGPGTSYTISEAWIWRFIQAQADDIE